MNEGPRLAAAIGRGWFALAAALALAGCSDGPDVRYKIVGLPRATADGCTPADAAPMLPGATKVRLTFRDDGPSGVGPFRCDVVLPLAQRPPMVAVPHRDQPVAVWAEYFDDAGNLLGRGQRLGVAIDGGGTVVISVAPSGDYACAPLQAKQARAFHSATLLPDGEVLLLGGLAGSTTAAGGESFTPDAGAYAIAAPELYDPATGHSTIVSIPGLLPRAFHQTVFVGADNGGYHLLVLGGHGVNGDAAAASNVAVLPGGGGQPPWQPTATDGALRKGARALPAELVSYSPSTKQWARVELSAGGPSLRTEAAATPIASSTGAMAIVGGRTTDGTSTALIEAVHADGRLSGTASGRTRVGASVTMMPSGDAIVYGGDVGSDTASVRVADRLGGLAASPSIQSGPTDTSPFNRAYHAAAPLGDGLLVFGGLHLSGPTVEDAGPNAIAVRVDGSLSSSQIDPGGASAVAYPDAIGLDDGGVLASGGARPAGACSRTLVCPTATSVRFDAGGSASAAGSLGLARYGHRLVLMPDGTVLVTGGFILDPADPSKLKATAIVEEFEGHRVADDPLKDLPVTRAAGDVARDTMGNPVAECTLVGGGGAPTVDAGPIDAPIDAP